MESILWGVAGLICGSAVAWLAAANRAQRRADELARSAASAEARAVELASRCESQERTAAEVRGRLEQEQQRRVESETRFAETEKRLDEQKKLLDEAQVKLKDAFSALSAESLKNSGDLFLKQADHHLRPLMDVLKRYEVQVQNLEKLRQDAYSTMSERLKSVADVSVRLQKETGSLVAALRAPQVRGTWGEMTLRRVVETAGMSSHCDFEEQPNVALETSRQRPDMIVRLPGKRCVIVDSKAPLEHYLEAAAAADPESRAARLREHAKSVKRHIDTLASRSYGAAIPESPEFVVLFLPGESIFSEAVMQDPTLIESAATRGVVLASPTILIAMLRAVAYGWQQQQLAENAIRIAEQGRELFDRLVTFADHFGGVGTHLQRSVNAFNKAVGSWTSRVVPSGQKFREMGAVPDNLELPAPEAIDSSARELIIPDSLLPESKPGESSDTAE